MREHIWRTGARANLALEWLPAAVGSGTFAVLEPPSSASGWVGTLLQQARAFRQKLAAADRLGAADRGQVWTEVSAAMRPETTTTNVEKEVLIRQPSSIDVSGCHHA